MRVSFEGVHRAESETLHQSRWLKTGRNFTTLLCVTSVPKFQPQPFAILGWDVADLDGPVSRLSERGGKFESYGTPGAGPAWHLEIAEYQPESLDLKIRTEMCLALAVHVSADSAALTCGSQHRFRVCCFNREVGV